MKCTRHRKDGKPCGGNAVNGTDACKTHAGRSLADQKAKGAVVVELRSWGLTDQLEDSTQSMLRLMSQAYRRAAHYSTLLEEAYVAAETLRQHHEAGALLTVDEDTLGGDGGDDDMGEPASLQVARDTLDRIFTTGGVGALIGATYASTPSGHIYATGEAIRGLQRLEAEERDRAFRFAKECRAAGLDERLVAVAEQQAQSIAVVLRAALADLGHDLTDPAVLQVVSTRVRELVIA